jgi:hypothetical protein
MPVRGVPCAWCGAELKVPAPDVGRGGYFLWLRECRHCAGQNLVELSDGVARAAKLRRHAAAPARRGLARSAARR